ncbi:MAG: hypothetical protein HRT74_08110 [Flavobacteriales bacterium]|nr:hypothetical protein [Flavobacteriales bacterium]
MKKTFTKIASMCCLAIFALMTNVAVAQDGCTDAGAINFDPAAVNDDGSCVVPGCADAPTIFNYCYDNNAADVLTWNEATAGSGVAINFTAGTVEAGFDVITIYDGPDNLSPILFSGDGDVTGLVFGSTGASLTVEITSDGSFSCVDGLITPAISVEIYCAAAVDGCTNPAGCDFDPLAVNDTGCDFSCYGCTDAGACNFDPAATIDDSSCDFSWVVWIDPSGCDFDPAFTIDG